MGGVPSFTESVVLRRLKYLHLTIGTVDIEQSLDCLATIRLPQLEHISIHLDPCVEPYRQDLVINILKIVANNPMKDGVSSVHRITVASSRVTSPRFANTLKEFPKLRRLDLLSCRMSTELWRFFQAKDTDGKFTMKYLDFLHISRCRFDAGELYEMLKTRVDGDVEGKAPLTEVQVRHVWSRRFSEKILERMGDIESTTIKTDFFK
ncbi:hypothetical protein M422DRAFT_261740 [Sphaerobolus stellatus SS14]|uniref:Uncharacterized protein n=1 Tax=Sphaerobolus stellatus (strain SS14) TaxID=990650 RepID=A0A0C9VEH2_SPHS4|nr:hypothetical protein M422DRAFT_261740 [Sphaerobolus stellatus SS14]